MRRSMYPIDGYLVITHTGNSLDILCHCNDLPTAIDISEMYCAKNKGKYYHVLGENSNHSVVITEKPKLEKGKKTK